MPHNREGSQRENYYRMGYCPQCQAQVMVTNTKGQFDSYRKNFLMADLIFGEDEHALRTVICETCFKSPDFTELMNSILHEKSEAYKNKSEKIAKMSRVYIERIYEQLGAPHSIEDATPRFIKNTMTAQLNKKKFQTMENPNEVFQN